MRKLVTLEDFVNAKRVEISFEVILKGSGARLAYALPQVFDNGSDEFMEVAKIFEGMEENLLAQDGSMLTVGTWRILTNEIAAIRCDLYEVSEDETKQGESL